MERRVEKPKPIIGKTLKEVKEVRHQHLEALLNGPLVVGVGIRYLETEENRQLALHVMLESELTPEQQQTFAKEIDGVPVVYMVTGKFVPYGDASENTPRTPQSLTINR